ncbi:MAG: hypothetical protein FWD42_03155 [Solirubrobacterales bacterium]|nr:hypothetical protein [Solirubrobacterales bacterium]
MRDHQQCSHNTGSAAPRARGGLRNLMHAHRRSGALALSAAAIGVALAAFSGTSSSHGASLGQSARGANSGGGGGGSSQANGSRARSATTGRSESSTRPLDEWTACERTHGDSNQADPTVDAHGVIAITIPPGAMPAGDPHDVTGTCSQYLAAARRALAGGPPVEGWGDQAKYAQYANCMRANGYHTYPYPSGIEPDGHSSTNFNGTGIDPESPAVVNGHANQMCGERVGAPAWWINNWGPAGDVTVESGPLAAGPPHNSPQPVPVPVPGANGVPGGVPGPGAAG